MAALEERRERTLEVLARHFGAGHVGQGTLEHRVEQAMLARTDHGLRAVTWDLPPLHGPLWRRVAERFAAPECTRLSIRAPTEVVLALDAGPRTWLVGRSRQCDVLLADPAISRRHALVSTRGGQCAVRDLGSTNGIAVNGIPVTTATLQPGDVVTFGGAVDALVR